MWCVVCCLGEVEAMGVRVLFSWVCSWVVPGAVGWARSYLVPIRNSMQKRGEGRRYWRFSASMHVGELGFVNFLVNF